MPKTIKGGAVTNINLSEEKSRFKLINQEEPEYEFLFEITSNRKISFKITFHNQENNTKEGLIRIDYKGGHKNPETLNDYVPDFGQALNAFAKEINIVSLLNIQTAII